MLILFTLSRRWAQMVRSLNHQGIVSEVLVVEEGVFLLLLVGCVVDGCDDGVELSRSMLPATKLGRKLGPLTG